MSKIENKDWQEFFPFEKPRVEQESCLNEILPQLKAGKRFIVADLPTGIGKSAIGITIARWAVDNLKAKSDKSNDGAYFLTTQKILQDQYMKDFAKFGMKNIKSASNYSCHFEPREDCAAAAKMSQLKGQTEWRKACDGIKCHYRQKKQEFTSSNLSVTSFAYFLRDSKLPRKKVLIIDEAHALESELMNYVEVSISQRFVENILNIKFPKYKEVGKKFMDWVMKDYFNALTSEYMEKHELVNKIKDLPHNNSAIKDILNKFSVLKNNYDKMVRFRNSYEKNKENWVEFLEERHSKFGKSKVLKFKPVNIAEFVKPYIYNRADYIIMMSATILNTENFCKNSGLKYEYEKGNICSIAKNSPFPAKNRKILFLPTGRMSKANINDTLPKMRDQIKDLLEMHHEDKGIIHAHSYKVAQYLYDNLKDKRLLIHGSHDRDEVLQEHYDSKHPTVLISPSMTEGVDLKGDLSRFQIIAKIPFPYMGDRQVKRKMAIDKDWYGFETLKKLIQSTGRSIRSYDDYATTYILDESWRFFYNRNYNMFPIWFKDAYYDLSNA